MVDMDWKKVAQTALFGTLPTAGIASLLTGMAASTSDASSKDLQAIRLERERQELIAQMAERQARVAQEEAIARRIAIADEVVIDEYYDKSGSGSAGLGIKPDAEITLGVSGSGQVISHRRITFKGFGLQALSNALAHEELTETYEQNGQATTRVN